MYGCLVRLLSLRQSSEKYKQMHAKLSLNTINIISISLLFFIKNENAFTRRRFMNSEEILLVKQQIVSLLIILHLREGCAYIKLKQEPSSNKVISE
jgi:hypothetical protein